jgi:hypothetical protein
MLDIGIMACGQIVSAQRDCFIQEKPKLYIMVARNAGIRSPSLLVFPAEIVNYTRLEFHSQVNQMIGNAQDAADILSPLCLVVEVG